MISTSKVLVMNVSILAVLENNGPSRAVVVVSTPVAGLKAGLNFSIMKASEDETPLPSGLRGNTKVPPAPSAFTLKGISIRLVASAVLTGNFMGRLETN